MSMLPAFCENCGTVFSSGLFLEGKGAIISGCTAGPCPNCGGTGHIPSGVFDFIGNTIKILTTTDSSVVDYSRLARMLASARKERLSSQVVADQIRKELPQFAGISELLRPKTCADTLGWATLLIATISLIVQMIQGRQDMSRISVDQVITQSFNQTLQMQVFTGNQRVKSKGVGRNDPCPCGSGKKYKKCCGAPK